jgi:hypothetical protein
VPTADEWAEVYASGMTLGYWTENNGTQFMNTLLLPRAGYRDYAAGSMVGITHGMGNASYWNLNLYW